MQATFSRTLGRLRNLYSAAFAVGGFLALAAVSFAYGLESAEGGRLSLVVVWAASVSPFLPVLAAFLAMDVWSDERLTGRIDLLLSVAVRERDFVIGKFLGVWAHLVAVVIASLVSAVGLLAYFAPQALDGTGLASWLLALFALSLQGFAWCAVSVALSAVFVHAAAAACASVILLVAIPRGLWYGLMSLSEAGRTAFGEMPLDAHVVDFASGLVPVGMAAAYVLVALTMLFVATKRVAAYRFVGRGALGLRVSTGVATVLSLLVCLMGCLLAVKANPVLDLSAAGASASLSPRTRSILSESGGGITVTCFLPRSDARFRAIGRLLRLMRREAASLGSGIELRFVDPRWDIGPAERLVHDGIAENSLVFEKGRRTVSVPVDDNCGERLFAASVRRVSAPQRRRSVCWTTGHGEYAHDAYGAFGLSDIARDLAQEGFLNRPIDLAAAQPIPGDCALIAIAGAKDDFSRAEIGRLDAYLREGGRLLVLLGSAKSGGIVSMLPSWGVRLAELPLGDARTLAGSDVIVSSFADHPISAPLKGSRIVLERPVSLSPSSVTETGVGVDHLGYSPVAEAGPAAVVAAVERGGGTGSDIALRPTRIVVIGDAGFVLNGALSVRASANRDFFLNCVAYLSGSETHASGGAEFDLLATGLDRTGRRRHLLWSAGVFPAAVFLLMAGVVLSRRRRS